MRREAFDAAGGYRAAFSPAEDLDLWIRIAAVSELANLAETVVSYRIHTGQSSLAELERQSRGVLAARVAWRARAQGLPDPFERTALLDREVLEAAGASAEELTTEFVRLAVWLAKTLSRSGNEDVAGGLRDGRSARSKRVGLSRTRLPRQARALETASCSERSTRSCADGPVLGTRGCPERAAAGLVERRRRPAMVDHDVAARFSRDRPSPSTPCSTSKNAAPSIASCR